jgi:hypothetical protein
MKHNARLTKTDENQRAGNSRALLQKGHPLLKKTSGNIPISLRPNQAPKKRDPGQEPQQMSFPGKNSHEFFFLPIPTLRFYGTLPLLESER